MSSIYTPDLTGEAEANLVSGDTTRIYKDNQVVDFGTPVFLDSIVIHKLGTVNVPLPDADWSVVEEADTEMGQMKLYDNSFDATLIRSISIDKAFVTEYNISISYQQLYPVKVDQTLLNGATIDITPDVLGEMLETIQYLKMRIAPITDTSTTVGGTPRLLEEDPHMENSDNFIEEEEHLVNYLEKKNVIRPLCGSFFKESFDLYVRDNPDPLVEGTDYVIFGVDIPKTKYTSIESGVYKFVMILKEIVDTVVIEYHAYGGEPTFYDMSELSKQINNLISYIQGATFLTSETLSQVPIIVNMAQKITELEDNMRRLTETPSYGDVTSGDSSVLEIGASDSDLHWYSIATLYTVDGSDTVITADVFRFRLESATTKFMFEASVSVNLNNEVDPFNVVVHSENYPKGFVPFEDYSSLESIIRPQLRIVYNECTDRNSGIILQLGFELIGMMSETIVIQDMSGSESCWKLISIDGDSVAPQDNTLVLPNDDHVYSTDNDDSVALTTLVPFKDGFIIWAGARSLNNPGGADSFELTEHLLPSNVDLTKITKVRFELKERDGEWFPVDAPIISGTESATGLGNFIYGGQNAQLKVSFWRDETSGNPRFEIYSNVDANDEAATLDFRNVFVFTG